jgi:hypothetical protein
MDLETSRRPPPVPALRSDLRGSRLREALDEGHLEDLALSRRVPLDALEARIVGILAETHGLYPDALVKRAEAPRIAVQEAVARLTRLLLLETPRALFTSARQQSSPFEAILDLEPVLPREETIAMRDTRAAILALSSSDFVSSLLALPKPLIAALDAREASYRPTERFASRAAFGLPDTPQPDQGARFIALAMRVHQALAPSPESLVLMRCLEGEPPRVPPLREAFDHVLTRLEIAFDLDSLSEVVLDAVLIALFGRRPNQLQPLEAKALFLADLGALLGRAAPAPSPAWLPFDEPRPPIRIHQRFPGGL